MLDFAGNWLRACKRRPKSALGVSLMLGLSTWLAWQGGRQLWFRHERTGALTALSAYDFHDARSRLNRCLEIGPNDPLLHLLAAQAARRDEDLEAAESHLDRYSELAGATLDGTLEQAMLTAQRGQLTPVRDYLISKLDRRYPASEQILEALMRGSLEIYLLDKAGFWAYELLDKHPKNPCGMLVRARLTEAAGDRNQALQLYRDLVHQYPNYSKARLELSELLFKTHAYGEAAEHFEQERRRRPDEPAALLGLARCMLQLDRHDEARSLFGRLEELDTGRADVLLECGKFALSENRLTEAERLLRRAVQLAPYNHIAYYQLGICLQQLNQTEESREQLRRSNEIIHNLSELEKLVEAVGRNPTDLVPRRQAGRIYLQIGQVQEGLRWLRGVLAIAPQDADAQAALKEYYAAHGGVSGP